MYEDLVKYLLMVRKKQKEPRVDTELVYAYAKVGQLEQLQEFISGTHQANLQACGDRCFEEVSTECGAWGGVKRKEGKMRTLDSVANLRWSSCSDAWSSRLHGPFNEFKL